METITGQQARQFILAAGLDRTLKAFSRFNDCEGYVMQTDPLSAGS